MITKPIQEILPNGTIIELMPIKGGSFMMGSGEKDNEQPIHKVHIPDFYLGKYPITVAQYMAFVEATQSNYPEWLEEGNEYHIHTGSNDYFKGIGSALTTGDHPITGVSWLNAQAFCKWVTDKTGHKYRLPSEAEWEYAARGGQYDQGYCYAGSNKLGEVGWYADNSHGATKPFGLKMGNELGLYDMSGNVYEWCADHWHGNYEGAVQDGSPWVDGKSNSIRVVRGGSWNDDAYDCRVSFRYNRYDLIRSSITGFRLSKY